MFAILITDNIYQHLNFLFVQGRLLENFASIYIYVYKNILIVVDIGDLDTVVLGRNVITPCCVFEKGDWDNCTW